MPALGQRQHVRKEAYNPVAALTVAGALAFVLNWSFNGSRMDWTTGAPVLKASASGAADNHRAPALANPAARVSPFLHSSRYRHIVIAHYEEHLAWAIPFGKDVVLMHKGPPLPPENASRFLAVHQLPNVGREAHSYIAYVLQDWDDLPSRIAFMQADAAMRDAQFLNGSAVSPQLNRWSHVWDINYWSGTYLTLPDPSTRDLGSYWQKFMPDISVPDLEQRECKTCYPIYSRSLFTTSREGEQQCMRTMHSLVSFTGILYVARLLCPAIRSRPREQYEAVLGSLNRSNAPVEAHFMERSWFPVSALLGWYLGSCVRGLPGPFCSSSSATCGRLHWHTALYLSMGRVGETSR